MPRHRYHQYCGLARALDVVGDRWTLLIVRELVPGPRRFTDLIDGLPGISRKLLTERLRELEGDGIVARKVLPSPAARRVYELTGEGRDLAAAIGPLIGWGLRRLGDRGSGESVRGRWGAVGLAALADREAARGVSETYQYVVGDSAFHFAVDDGSIQLHDGWAESPAVTLTTDEGTAADIVAGRATGAATVSTDAVTVSGDHRAAKRLVKILFSDEVFAQAEAVVTAAGEG